MMDKEPALAALGALLDHIALDATKSIAIRSSGGRFRFQVDRNDEPAT